MNPGKRVTLKEIAKRARVATGTVSMVLNEDPRIAEATRMHVRQVMRALGYVYNRGAAQIRSKRSNIVGVSICNLNNPYFAEIAAAIEQSLDTAGKVLVLGNCRESVERQSRFLNTLREYNVEGVLLMPAIGTPKAVIAQLAEWRIPVVMVSRRVLGAKGDFVGVDNKQGTRMSTEYLIQLGHKRIAFVGVNRHTSTGRDRAEGYRTALMSTGLPVVPEMMVECDATRADGFKAITSLYKQRHRPTAIVCFNDLLAFGVMLGLRHLNCEPGRECAVTGFDDVDEASLWWPQLTTIAANADALGDAAGRLLRDRIAEPGRSIQRVTLEPRLIVRASCGPPPKSTN
jgi:LacI family transcriptional regulator